MFNQTQKQIIDGLIISDAYVAREGLFYISQTSKYHEYVVYIANQLDIEENRVKIRARQPDKRTGKIYECSELRTLSHPVYLELRKRWYKNGRKVVPRDLVISKEFILHWFLGDGCCSINRNGAILVLCTDAFTKSDVEYLKGLMKNIGINCTIQKNNRLRIPKKDMLTFFDYMGDCPVDCLAYKWLDRKYLVLKQRSLKPFYSEIYRLYLKGWSLTQIAEKFDTNYFSIRYILKHSYSVSLSKNSTNRDNLQGRRGCPLRDYTQNILSTDKMKT